MSELNVWFRKKLRIPENKQITFEDLHDILEKTATAFPFENFRVLSNQFGMITKDYLRHKILVKNEGGLCYELNPLLYFFLLDNGFNAKLIRGEVFDNDSGEWKDLGRTHIAIILQENDRDYLVDTGFGGNLPLMPVPLNNETISSRNGEFRVRPMESDYGDSVLDMKLKYKDTKWKIGYAFDPSRPIENMHELNDVQEIIVKHEQSPFNKTPLITRMTAEGNITLSPTSVTQWVNGKLEKEQIDYPTFKLLAYHFFGVDTSNLPGNSGITNWVSSRWKMMK
ncbi:arylamine N-acetyltransferase [Alkalihalobacillus sp. TS-13]|uniref:arylamine N-acetyltransferase family protein n=1 Tax=Alkalihalobacillus sp. TS-13 TaxID=2842455 RepID=UPI001C87E7C8|nr:arylamine N-acetyltransferase [Alkalihalobacillus sp. TS-13]